ncbi:NEQ402 [Nanoarchaeum equitans Kin4-M]|uniref:NEQ402 n=1 Tax=Nanoarchaeum equitans (strain Kin4-M) TaxID=228908 RepID=Q74MF0_NANEQ|nr:NEQ402 [Nanoarchaeum equitans Kin4-M]
MKPVRDLNVNKNTTIEELIKQFSSIGGFQAQELYRGYEILKEMFDNAEYKILSFPADIIATGIRGIIKELIKRKMFDLVITTCGTLDHDLARLEKDYYLGYFEADDIELREKNIFRLGNIFIPEENYGLAIENILKKALPYIYNKKKELSTYEFVWLLGEYLENHPKKEESIIYWAYKNRIPIIIPGITDGAVGTQILLFRQEHRDFNVNVWLDEEFLLNQFFGDKNIGALMLGGGISKHHTIWWAQFSNGLKYAVYVTSAVELDGSLSGARTREAISWGKIDKKAKHVTIWGDVTIILPLLVGPFL